MRANFWRFSNRSHFFSLKLMVIKARSFDFVLLFRCFIRKFAVSFDALLCMTFQQKSWIRTHVTVHNILACLTFSLSTTQINMVKEWCRFSQINVFMSIFQVGLIFCFFPPSMISSTYTDKKSPSSRSTNKHSQFGNFSQPCSIRTFSHCLSHNSPAKGWPYRFRSRGTTGTSILDHDFGHFCRGRRLQMSGHSDFWKN